MKMRMQKAWILDFHWCCLPVYGAAYLCIPDFKEEMLMLLLLLFIPL
jgi:hypothetical protein